MSRTPALQSEETLTATLDAASEERPVRLGNYDVVGLIASGGMGKVYDAIHRDHRARVALKTLVHVDVERVMRFKNEFRYVADLCHPNLVPLYELGCHDGLWFITMERVDGVPFLEWVRPPTVRVGADESVSQSHQRNKTALDRDAPTFVDEPRDGGAPAASEPTRPAASPPPSIDRVRDAFAQLARAVSALHAAGLLHLDIKPNNVLVDRDGRVVVLDFGLARLVEHKRRDNDGDEEPTTISGTPTWMPPEQFELATLDEAADWYAVGLMLYVALTGVFPFPTGAVAAIWFAKRSVVPTAPKDLVRASPDDLSSLASDLLLADRARRPSGNVVLERLSGERSIRADARRAEEFIGRETERARLRDAIAQARDESTVVIHLAGTSGLGKSALLRRFVRDAEAQSDVLVLRGRCYERETVPFKALDGVIDALAQHLETLPQEELHERLPTRVPDLARAFPSLSRVPAIARRLRSSVGASSTNSIVELRRRASEALRRLLGLLTRRGPVALIIDDLQWADADSAALLVGLLDAPAPPKLVLACSYRPEEAAANRALAPYFEQVRARAAERELAAITVKIEPLSTSESESLASSTLQRLGLASQALVAHVARESSGVPFYIEELAHFAARQGHSKERSTELSLDTVLAQRVRALDAHERALVEVLSVANSPIPMSLWFSVAHIHGSPLRALWSLRGQHFVHSTGAQATDQVELHHDRMRESIYRELSAERTKEIHLGLARAFAALGAGSPWLFDAVRHGGAVRSALSEKERSTMAELALAAGRSARASAAFRLAFDCFREGLAMLGDEPWTSSYELALALHSGAADAAYLCADWSAVDHHVSAVRSRHRAALDQLQAWEAHIDSCIARKLYDDAVDTALDALAQLDVHLPARPTEQQLGAYVHDAIAAVTQRGPSGALKLPRMQSPRVSAAMRLQSRIGSATYFARPALFPVLACNGVVLSMQEGVATATPYAIAVFAVVLNSLGQFREAHTWGQVALSLLDRSDDRAMDARTLHVVHDLVCTFTVPLDSSLDHLRPVVELGQEIGDPEYAAYAAHAFVHNALWACRPLEPLLQDAVQFERFMREYEQDNALHVHSPFEQTLRCLLGQTVNPASLDGDGFSEQAALTAAREAGSRSALFLVQMLMGLVRYYFASPREASALFEAARPFIDGVASTWHVPMFHQYAALAIWAIDDESERAALAARAEESEAALAPYAEAGPENFAHRITLVRAAKALANGGIEECVTLAERAATDAERSGFHADVGIARTIAAEAMDRRGDRAGSDAQRRAANEAWTRWNALAVLTRNTRRASRNG